MSADGYTPRTQDVRQTWAEEQDTTHGLGYDAHAAEFDRWLAAHDAEVREAAAPAEHTVTATWDGGGWPTYRFHCAAGPQSLCHAVYDCLCEEWDVDGVEGGRPWHALDDGPRHVGTFNSDVCNLRDWFENTDDPLHGELTFAVDADYQGDFYLFRPTAATR
ncbi:hypothetical protein [Cellulomonas shaoxiangyii]|uniref:Uncharacterized protein n=1 Tax=Cellulomonas shaoxiangyii TaxID=2566013 RepID=A0A4P7SI85_9CELL|nr:hypothetical protein [Cellulomonas shaoxiangyii]QCB93328.1 hypothetical protein E5225_06950 [Cellulomonas shaoxiangyii]TGY79433.1 hypothetical protein E5226_15480 [Cellulomonas shaoxiangyii]